MDENHIKFLNHLDKSEKAVNVVATWLASMGYDVSINELKRAKNHENWHENIDNGDIILKQRIEVKQLSVNFSSINDWPFKEKFIVCAKHSFDNVDNKPLVYIILNKDGTYAAVVYGNTNKYWYVESRQDNRYIDVWQQFYLCPLSYVKFIELNKNEYLFF